MSELITRRTFLKTTGAAVLVTAAGGLLTGCGEGTYASTPDGLVPPAINGDNYADFGSFNADIGPLSGQWVSSSLYENGERHNYFYTSFKVDNSSGQSPVTIKTGNFKFSHTGGSTGTIVGLGYKGLNSDKTDYVFYADLTVAAGASRLVTLFIDLGPLSTSSFQKFYTGTITITLSTFNNKKATFTYNGLIADPTCTMS